MGRPLTRITPVGPSQAYRTFQIVAPPDHTVVAACEQVGCPAWTNGWETAVDEALELGRQQADYIRRHSGRTFTELRRADNITVFRFASRQRCFTEHRTRPEFYVVKDGDWRASQNARRHTSADDWVDDFRNHQDNLATRLERG